VVEQSSFILIPLDYLDDENVGLAVYKWKLYVI